MDYREKYLKLVKELITPLGPPPPDECIQQGIEAFDIAFQAGQNVHMCQMSARSAMHSKAKELPDG